MMFVIAKSRTSFFTDEGKPEAKYRFVLGLCLQFLLLHSQVICLRLIGRKVIAVMILVSSSSTFALHNGKGFHDLVLPDQASDVAKEKTSKRGLGFFNPSADRSDLNLDGFINTQDLKSFSEHILHLKIADVDWCLFHSSVIDGTQTYKPNYFFVKHYPQLLDYIYSNNHCNTEGPSPSSRPAALDLIHNPRFLARISSAKNFTNDYYVSDPLIGSVFIYDSGLNLKQELKGLASPLGIAVNLNGEILVGNNGRDNVEVYSPDDGSLIASFGEGSLEMPTAITIGPDQNIYVVDSLKNSVVVFDNDYNRIGSIGAPGFNNQSLNFPADAVIYSRDNGTSLVDEIYVADQGNRRIQVYDLDDNHQRSILPPPPIDCIWFQKLTGLCQDPAPFIRIQGLYLDSQGRLHVVDMFSASVSLIDPVTHGFLGSYGRYGSEDGELKLPVDVIEGRQFGEFLVTDPGNNKIETYVVH